MSHYQSAIREILARSGNIGVDPRHVEAYMRLEFKTLDHLTRERFRAEVVAIVPEIREDVVTAERLAESYGL